MSKVALSWDLPTARTDGSALSPDEIASIDIFDTTSPTPLVPIGSTKGAQTSFTTDTQTVGDHSYDVIVNDTTGHKSAASDPFTINVPATLAAPNPATNLQGSLVPDA